MITTVTVEQPYRKSHTTYQNFQYLVLKKGQTVSLSESFQGHEVIVGKVSGWRAKVFDEFAESLVNSDERERGYRLFLTLQLLKCLKTRRKTNHLFRAITGLSLEEVIFWVWQFHSYGNSALNAFNCIHMRSTSRRKRKSNE